MVTKTVRGRLYGVCALFILILFAVQGYSYWALRTAGAEVHSLADEDVPIFEALSAMEEANLHNRIYWREAVHGYQAEKLNANILFAQKASLEKARGEEAKIAAALATMKKLVGQGTNPEDVTRVEALGKGFAEFVSASTALDDAVRAGRDVESAGLQVARVRDQVFGKGIDDYAAYRKARVDASRKLVDTTMSNASQVQLTIAVIALGLALLLAYSLSRSIAGPLTVMKDSAKTLAQGDFTASPNCLRHCGFGRATGCKGSSCEIGAVGASMGEMRSQLSVLVRQVQEKAGMAQSQSGALADSLAQSAAAFESQSEQVMRVSAATEELNVSVAEVAQTITAVHARSSSAAHGAERGQELVTRTRDSMRGIQLMAESSAFTVLGLTKAAQGVQSLTGEIREIAEQTNLLALNAAIEAARAGESGRGFAVVADEVRKLAEKTQIASKSIAELTQSMATTMSETRDAIGKIEKESQSGVAEADQTTAALVEIVGDAKAIQEMVGDIHNAASEQKIAADGTAQAMEAIASATEENESALCHVNQTAREMAELAKDLQQTVSRFKVAPV